MDWLYSWLGWPPGAIQRWLPFRWWWWLVSGWVGKKKKRCVTYGRTPFDIDWWQFDVGVPRRLLFCCCWEYHLLFVDCAGERWTCLLFVDRKGVVAILSRWKIETSSLMMIVPFFLKKKMICVLISKQNSNYFQIACWWFMAISDTFPLYPYRSFLC